MGKTILAAWICLGLVILSTSYLFTYQERLRLNLDRLAHAHATLSLNHDLQNNLADAEAAARGYVITGDEGQLSRYREALREAPENFAGLREITRDAPAQQRLLNSLQPLIQKRLTLLQQSIDLRRQKPPDAPEQAVLARQGAGIQAKIRRILEGLEDLERKALAPGWAKQEKRIKILLWGLALTTYLGFSLLLLVIYLLTRESAERRQAEKKLIASQEDLRALASQLTLAEERERRRLAVHLHDQVGQTLALANIKLGEMQNSTTNQFPQSDQTELGKIGKLLEQAIRDTHSLTFKISSPILYELGLEAALESLVEQVQQEHGLVCRFESDGGPHPLDDDVRVLLYQSVSELLVNVVKHARARNLKVSMRRQAGDLKVEVADDGVGFRPLETGVPRQERGGFGLFSIRERLRPVGGHLEVQSRPGAGARVTLTAPLQVGAP
jgi:signal transduction histidine kinase